jgi:hypothetical protein
MVSSSRRPLYYATYMSDTGLDYRARALQREAHVGRAAPNLLPSAGGEEEIR